MDAETKQAYRTTMITNEYRQDVLGQNISLVRQVDNFTPAEEFFYLALLGQPQQPVTVQADNSPLLAAKGMQEFINSTKNIYYFSPDRQTVFVKIYDTHPAITILVSGLHPLPGA